MGSSFIDLIIRIKNGYIARRQTVEVNFSKLAENILKKLIQLGFIKSYKTRERKILVELLYKDKQPALTDVKIHSKPGRRWYVSYKKTRPVLSGIGYSILSTPRGILTDKEARKQKIGGELLFDIW